MMLTAYFEQYPAHLAAAARRQAAVAARHHDPHPDAPCPLHPDGIHAPFLTYPLMASVPEEERSEGGRTYTVSSNSDQQEAQESKEVSLNGDYYADDPHPSIRKHSRSSPRSSPTSEDTPPLKKDSSATTDSFHTARVKSVSEVYFAARDPGERSSQFRDHVYDPTRKSYIPRDPDCPIHSPSRMSPVRTTPSREIPTRNTPFSRNSPTRITSPRLSPVRGISRGSPGGVTPPKISPSTSLIRSSPVRLECSRSNSIEGPSSLIRSSPPPRPERSYHSLEEGPAVPPFVRMGSRRSSGRRSGPSSISTTGVASHTRSSAAESELLHCTVCKQQFNNPKVLPCLHSFCEECLLSTTPAEALTISCPECRQQSILPQAGVTHLQNNTWVQGVISSLEADAAPRQHPGSGEPSTDEGVGVSPPQCGLCSSASPTLRCRQCLTSLCASCVEAHTKESEHYDFDDIPVLSDGGGSSPEGPHGCEDEAGSPVVKGEAREGAPEVVEEVRSPVAVTEGSHSFHDETQLHCPSHEGMTLRFYCRDCDTAVCISCTDIEHRMHTTMRLANAMQDQTTAMLGLVDAVANKLPAVECCVEDLSEAMERLSERRQDAEEAVRAAFGRLREAVDAREKRLLETLEDRMEDKRDMLEAQRTELQCWVSGMESGRALVQRALQESKAPMELVLLKKQFGDKLKEYVDADVPPGPRENTLLSFEPTHLDAALAAVVRVGSVVTNPAVPYTTIASGDNLKQVPVGRRGRITVITRDFKGERVSIGRAELSASFTPKSYPTTHTPSPPVSPCSYSSKSSYPNLHGGSAPIQHTTSSSRTPSEISSSPQPLLNGHTSTSNGHHHQHQPLHHYRTRRHSTSDDGGGGGGSTSSNQDSSVKVVDLNNGVYEVEFVLHRPGRYSLDLCLYGMPIDQSPFTVTALPMGSACSVHGSEHSSESPYAPIRQRRSTHFSALTGRTPKSSGHSPSQRSSASRVTLPIEDDLIMKVGIKGRGKGEFVNPQGICYSGLRGGRIVVTDSLSQCVQVFSSEGEFKIRFGTRGRNVGQMQRPTGVATLPNGNYAVADYENKCVSIFEPNGKYVHRIGQGKLLGPKGVCADRHGNIIVVDNKGSCVCIFQSNGRLLTKFGNRGTSALQFAGPHFVAVDSRGQIVTTDFHNHCVKVFDSEGEFLYTFGSHGEGNGQFNAPTGVAVDDNDNIIVADWGNSRIQVFDCHGSFLFFVNTLAEPLHGPQGLAYTEDGHIIVADSGNHCFKVYKYLQ